MKQNARKRRRNKEGALFQRKDGRWVARVSHDGQRTVVYGKSEAEAAQKLRKLLIRQDQGIPLVTSAMLVRDYLDQWLTGIKHRIRPGVYEAYEVIVRVHLSPALGHIKLANLAPEHIEGAWAKMLRAVAQPASSNRPTEDSPRPLTTPCADNSSTGTRARSWCRPGPCVKRYTRQTRTRSIKFWGLPRRPNITRPFTQPSTPGSEGESSWVSVGGTWI